MSVSRDFIDSYSPEVPDSRTCAPRSAARGQTPWDRQDADCGHPGRPFGGQCGPTVLVFGFHATENLLKTLISLSKIGRFLLGLAQELLQRVVQADRLVDLGARPRPVGAEPDQLLHVRI